MADDKYDSDDLADDLAALVDMGLVAVTGRWPDLRYVVTPEGHAEMARHEAEIRTEARELAERRYTASQTGNIIPLTGA